jgi:hypothetical protein
VDHQVVAGANLDGQRRAGELHRRRERREATAEGAATTRDVGEDGRRELRGLLDHAGVDALEVSDHVGQCGGLAHGNLQSMGVGCRSEPGASGESPTWNVDQSSLTPDSLTIFPSGRCRRG